MTALPSTAHLRAGAAPTGAHSEAPFWVRGAAAQLEMLASRPEGLTAAEAAERLASHGPNVAVAAGRKSLLAKLVKRLTEPLVAILLIAAGVSGATGDWQSFVIILLIVLFSIGLDLFQEEKAEAAVEALKRSVAVSARVRRGGQAIAIPVREVVPGDVVELTAGDLVPADGILLSSRGALANEVALTGEAYGAEKAAGDCAALDIAEATNALFAGTSIVGGVAVMLVTATGADTRFGHVAASVQAKVAPGAFERGIHGLGMLILRLTGFLVLFVLLTQLLQQGLTLEAFLFAVALAVGLTPELLPMVTTVTLSRGAVRMAARQVVVKRLAAIHDLGAMDVLCTDKTGTLTQARIALVGSFDAEGLESPRAVEAGRLNSRFVSGLHSNLDDALLADAPADAGSLRCLADRPFDFDTRRATVLLSEGPSRRLVTKGAAEMVLPLCHAYARQDGTLAPLDAGARARLSERMEAKGREGFRLLAVASAPADDALADVEEAGAPYVFLGCLVFLDPPKDSATEAIARLAAAGVRVKIVSGDAGAVVRHLVETLHLPASGLLTGAEMEDMSDLALAAAVEKTDLFVRVSPEQKSRIVRALRARGHTVGFIGDGINDAPAIHAADVGLSVDGGTDVAREAADIILLAPDLGVLADGVREGRRTYANIMKYVRMGTSSNFGNMLSMAAASLVLPFLPLAPLQILLNNLLYDLSEIGIPFDQADEADLIRPQAWDMGAVLRFTLIMGPLSSVFDLVTFAVLSLGFSAPPDEFRTAWFVESIATQILVIFLIRTRGPAWASRPDRVLAATSLGALAVALLIALTPLGSVVGFVPLPASLLGAIAVLTVLYLACAEGLKRFAIKPSAHGPRPAGRRAT